MSALTALPLRDGAMTIETLIGLFMAHYAGRDNSLQSKLRWWITRIGQVALRDLSDDQVHAELAALEQCNARYYAGKDDAGRPVLNSKRNRLSPATINRYAASLATVLTWAIKRRIAPKGFVHPCRSIERRPEHNERTRFLSDEERARLLQAAQAASWPRLYVLVLMALTTGARKGELVGLRWADIDFDRAEAYVQTTKNRDPRVLPLIPGVMEELRRFVGKPEELVFASPRDARRAFTFEPQFVSAVRAARLREVTFHTLRHTCASYLARHGATLLEVADLLGHRQLQVTKRYSHLATSHKTALVNRLMGSMQ